MNLIATDLANKTIFIDFYMEHCPWCYYCLNDFNEAIDSISEMYGSENVAFLKVDGTRIR